MRTAKWLQFSPEAGIVRINVQETAVVDGKTRDLGGVDIDKDFHALPETVQAPLLAALAILAREESATPEPVKPEPTPV